MVKFALVAASALLLAACSSETKQEANPLTMPAAEKATEMKAGDHKAAHHAKKKMKKKKAAPAAATEEKKEAAAPAAATEEKK